MFDSVLFGNFERIPEEISRGINNENQENPLMESQNDLIKKSQENSLEESMKEIPG